MGALPYIAAGMQVAGTVVNAMGSEQQTKSDVRYYKYLSAVSKQNADIALAKGKEESRQAGAESAQRMGQLELRSREAIGSQKAALAAGGAGAGSKTAEQVVSDTINKTDLDEQVLRYNTDLRIKNIAMDAEGKAFNYRAQGRGYDMAAKNARIAGHYRTLGTILGGASSTASFGAQMNR